MPVGKKKRRKKKWKGLDKYLLGAVIYIVGWSVAFFVSWLFLKQEPSILEGCILAPGVVEMIACAFIKQGKTKYGGNVNEQTGTETEQS